MIKRAGMEDLEFNFKMEHQDFLPKQESKPIYNTGRH